MRALRFADRVHQYVSQQLLADTKEQLSALPTAHPQRYAVLLQGLIKQGAKALGEKDISVMCRRDDLAIVKAALASLSKDEDLAGLTLSVKEAAFLPATWCVACPCALPHCSVNVNCA